MHNVCMAKTFVVIGDTHFPFTNLNTLYGKGGVIEAIKNLKPDYVIQVGDLYDFYSWGKWPYKRDIFTPKEEIERGREMAVEMWQRIKKVAPRKCKLYQLKGNHDERPAKQLISRFPEIFSVMRDPIHDLFVFDGVSTHREERDPLIIDEIMFMHGFRSRLGSHCIHNHMSTVCGHSHTGGCVYVRRGNKVIWELNAGFAGDENSGPLSYTRNRAVSRWTQGFAIIDQYGPRFVALENK